MARAKVLGLPFQNPAVFHGFKQRTLDAARDFGLRRVELTVRENNAVAIELYKKLGFAVEGLQRNRILVDGIYENLVLMGVVF